MDGWVGAAGGWRREAGDAGGRDRRRTAVSPARGVGTRQTKVAAAASGRGVFPGEETKGGGLAPGDGASRYRPQGPVPALVLASRLGPASPPSPGEPSSRTLGPAQPPARQVDGEAGAPVAHLRLGGELDHRLPEVQLGVGRPHGAGARSGPAPAPTPARLRLQLRLQLRGPRGSRRRLAARPAHGPRRPRPSLPRPDRPRPRVGPPPAPAAPAAEDPRSPRFQPSAAARWVPSQLPPGASALFLLRRSIVPASASISFAATQSPGPKTPLAAHHPPRSSPFIPAPAPGPRLSWPSPPHFPPSQSVFPINVF